MNVVEAEDLHYSYGENPVLRGCSFRVTEGEFVVLAGPNGAGKSTLFSLISLCREPSSGRISLFGKEAAAWDSRALARQLAILPQNDLVPPGMTVYELVLLGRSPFLGGFFRFDSRTDRETAMECLRRVGVDHLAGRYAGTLSGGERRLVMLARALAQEPSALLLDEPAASLDLHHQQAIFRLLRRLNREEGITIIAVTHDLNLAALYCSRMMLLHEGRIAANGKPEELLREDVLRPIYHADLWIETRPDGSPVVGLLP